MIIGGGIANGLFGILMSMTWPHYYGREHLGAISGLCMTFMVIFSSIGPAFYSKVLEYTGDYTLGHVSGLIFALILFVGSFFARNPQKQK